MQRRARAVGFYEESTSEELLGLIEDLDRFVLIDAIDNLTAKTHLISTCRARGIPLVVSGGASGRMDPTQIREADLTEVRGDPFLAATRKILRKQYGLAREGSWGIPTVHSLEAPADPLELSYDGGEGFSLCVPPGGQRHAQL